VTPLSSFPTQPGSSTINGTPPQARTGTMTVAGQNLNVLFRSASVTFSSGKAMESAGWGSALSRGINRGRRSVSFEMQIIDDDSSSLTTILQNALTATPVAVSMVIGSVAGLRCTLTMPKVLLANPTKGYGELNRTRTITGQGYPSASGALDELTVTWS
jgi:hypothetical protein